MFSDESEIISAISELKNATSSGKSYADIREKLDLMSERRQTICIPTQSQSVDMKSVLDLWRSMSWSNYLIGRVAEALARKGYLYRGTV